MILSYHLSKKCVYLYGMEENSHENRALRGLAILVMVVVLGAMKTPVVPFIIIGGVGLWVITKIFN